MDLSEYRREYAAFCSAFERARFEHHIGLSAKLDLTPVRERYAELWTREKIAELRRAEDATHAQFETERAGLAALRGAAELNHLEDAAREVSNELGRCAASARVEWGGALLAADAAPALIASEPDAMRRRELSARWSDAASACDDLRASRLEVRVGASRSLGYESLRALHENLSGVSFDELAAGAARFLEQTAPAYMLRLSEWAAREIPSLPKHALTYADALFFERAASLDIHFLARRLRADYEEAMADLGIRVEQRRNMTIDDAERPLKNPRPACFGVNPPEDVRLSISKTDGGADAHRVFFREAARAERFAWASRDTATRHPEFVHPPDGATGEAFACLFAGLFRDPAWLGERGVFPRAADAETSARRFALIDLYEARRACALMRYALALSESAGRPLSEQLSDAHASALMEATGFRHDAAPRLLDADEAFRAAERLRARLFAASLREHLRGRHGRRWFDSRAAGGELIDLWNTASRYPVEELARLAWGGRLDFDLLAEELTTAVSGG